MLATWWTTTPTLRPSPGSRVRHSASVSAAARAGEIVCTLFEAVGEGIGTASHGLL